ncbi:MAG TPA: hypothetical protein VFA64_09115 [Hyphomicrobiaceae bacterium]|nr:hypothetical protein [Hyphomicrobiaceae bacterium]
MVRHGGRRVLMAGLAAGAIVGMTARAAKADAIDGEWCLGSSHFAIDGPNITTPGGNRIQGNYSRHGFDYVVPANEPGAGGRIDMVLLNEETVQLTRAGQAAAPEIWRRCRPTS